MTASAGEALSQQISLSLDEAVALAQDSTIAASEAMNASLAAYWSHQAFIAQRKPQLSFNIAPDLRRYYNDPTSTYLNVKNFNMLTTNASLRLEQQALGLGGNFYAQTGLYWAEFFNGSPRTFSSTPLGVGYSNDLIGFNPYRLDKEIRDAELERSGKELIYKLEQIAGTAATYYLDYLVADALYEIYRSDAESASHLYEIGREKFEIASITRNELLALQLQLLNIENQITGSRQQKEDARRALLSYLNMDDLGQELSLTIPQIPGHIDIDPEDAVTMASENNPEYLRTREEILSARQDLKKAEAQSGLQSSVDMHLGLQSYGQQFVDAYNTIRPSVLGIVTLRVPIVDHGLARNRRRSAEYALSDARDRQDDLFRNLRLDVYNALGDFNIQQELISSTQAALELADSSYRLAEELYGNGDIDINTFVLAQDRKDEAYRNYLSSLKEYWKSYYSLCGLCLYDFANGCPLTFDSLTE